MPELKDLTFRQARARVSSYGLKVDSVQYRPAECAGCVVDVLRNGKRMKQGVEIERGKGVVLVVGSGESHIKINIPPMYEMKYDEVDEFLLGKGLNPGLKRFDETVKTTADSGNAFVFKQNPEYDADVTINLGRSIDLFFTIDSTKLPDFELMPYDTLEPAF